MSFHQPIAVKEDGVAVAQEHLLLLVAHARHRAQGHAGGPQFGHAALVAPVGQVVPGVGVCEPPASRVEDGVEARDEHLRRHVWAEQSVGLL